MQYIWNNKLEPIARKIIFSNKKLGGLNLIEPQAHNLPIRIKHLLQLKQKHKIPSWKNIATYWLAIDLHNYSKDFNFLIDSNRIKTINNKKHCYYQDIIYYIKNENKDIKTMKNPTTKNISKKIIQAGSKQHKIAAETLWKKHLPKVDFQQIWKNTYISYAQLFCTDLQYRLLQYSTKTNEYMHKCTKDINPKCDQCGYAEDNIHLFTKCPRIKKIWTHYQPSLTKLTGKNYNPQQHLLTLSVTNLHKHATKLTLTIIQIILHKISESRNNNKQDKTLLSQDTIITKINAQLRNVIQTYYKYHKLNDTINAFEELFCIKQAIGNVENNHLRGHPQMHLV